MTAIFVVDLPVQFIKEKLLLELHGTLRYPGVVLAQIKPRGLSKCKLLTPAPGRHAIPTSLHGILEEFKSEVECQLVELYRDSVLLSCERHRSLHGWKGTLIASIADNLER
eukprot:symbB.v1.2.004269.t1/scaffold222.1/size270942/11